MTETVSRSASADGWSEPTKASARATTSGIRAWAWDSISPASSPRSRENGGHLGFPRLLVSRPCPSDRARPVPSFCPMVSAKGPGRHGGDHREGDRDQHRRPEREGDRRDGHAHGLLVEHQPPVPAEGLCDHQRREGGGHQKSDDPGHARGQLASPTTMGPKALIAALARATAAIVIQSAVTKTAP